MTLQEKRIKLHALKAEVDRLSMEIAVAGTRTEEMFEAECGKCHSIIAWTRTTINPRCGLCGAHVDS